MLQIESESRWVNPAIGFSSKDEASTQQIAWDAIGLAERMKVPCSDEVHTWHLELDNPSWPLLTLESWLSPEDRARASYLRFDVHKRRYTAAHRVIRALLGSYVERPRQTIRFQYAMNGKPLPDHLTSLEAGDSSIPFSMSHSAQYGLLAVAANDCVGADIEVQRNLSDLEAIAGIHFTAGELQEVCNLEPHRRHDGFFAAWTRKEAYVNADGSGLSTRFDSFEVSLNPDEKPALRTIVGHSGTERSWTLWLPRPTASS